MTPLPPHWSIDQVIAVDQFLLHLRDQLWLQYRLDLQPLFGGDETSTSANASDEPSQQTLFDDADLPF